MKAQIDRPGGTGYLGAAVVVTLVIGFGYLGIQQALRQGADHPQAEMARDLSASLNSGAAPTSLLPATAPVDLAASGDPFVAIYDVAGRVLATNGTLGGAPPAPPIGVLDAARAAGRDRVTWQPRPGVRIALIVLPWTGGTVLAGRSLAEVEHQKDVALFAAIGAWLIALGVVTVTWWRRSVRRPA